MTVADLIRELNKFNPDLAVHLDVSAEDGEWEGDRVVRSLSQVRLQPGYFAIALDASYSLYPEDTKGDEEE